MSLVLGLAVGIFFVSCQDSAMNSIDDKDGNGEALTVQSSNGGTQSVFFSDENVKTWDHINVATVSDWPASVCKDDGSGSIGLNDSRWSRTEGQTAFDIRPLLDGGLHAFEKWWGGIHHPNNFGEAEWINAVYKRYSKFMNPDGQGHNWTRYEVPVDGNGTFELRLLADNCSWVYLDDKLVGYQDDADVSSVDGIRYGVTLNGPATLTYIIFDGGGDAGGKFRLETTTEEELPVFEDPTEPNNQAPVADAGADRTVEATGPTTAVTLAGSGTDADGDSPLTFTWSDGSTGQAPTVNLGLGTHTFTLTVADPQGAAGTDDVTITVVDTTPPELAFMVEDTELWPPNHKMRLVASGISISDIADSSPTLDIAVTSNEHVNGRGDGNTDSDWNIIDNGDGTFDVEVRAERSGNGNGRTYTITIGGADASGNTVEETIEVTVPHSKKGGRRR